LSEPNVTALGQALTARLNAAQRAVDSSDTSLTPQISLA